MVPAGSKLGGLDIRQVARDLVRVTQTDIVTVTVQSQSHRSFRRLFLILRVQLSLSHHFIHLLQERTSFVCWSCYYYLLSTLPINYIAVSSKCRQLNSKNHLRLLIDRSWHRRTRSNPNRVSSFKYEYELLDNCKWRCCGVLPSLAELYCGCVSNILLY
ncbi:hypothetical protein LIPSTDRAFT_309251 [Lipomyces starkeyi NRRL Y-11557]|uniref:Uncharacterized protein n=1 Tax=Lipomyces starkeyi NRRL Y-11557 TaxID=675824 RepID=A0A1E3Q6P4_LIPST|nr:hypothetical protein LIPSTDRAFT_309251 [Lipomyces starkeyi NRRL Y-11557]